MKLIKRLKYHDDSSLIDEQSSSLKIHKIHQGNQVLFIENIAMCNDYCFICHKQG